MNSIILKSERDVIFDKNVVAHLHKTLKVKVGDELKATVLNLGFGKAKLISISDESAEFEFISLEKKIEPWFDLIIGASRPQTMKKVLEHGTTFGAKSFHIYKATLSEKSYLDSQIYNENELNELTHLGLSQSAMYFREPEVKKYNYNPANQFSSYVQKFILDPKAKQSFLDVTIDFTKPILLSIGPERGFSSEDLSNFENNNFKSIKISSSILRVEQATFATIAQLEMLRNKL